MPMTRLFRLSVALLCGLTLAVAAQGDWTRDASQFLVHWAALTAIYLLVLLTAGCFGPRRIRRGVNALSGSVIAVKLFGVCCEAPLWL